MSHRVLVCGASGGLGAVVAAELQNRGMQVHGTMRNPGSVSDYPFPMRALDVTDESSVVECLEGFRKEAGGLDVVVNCFNQLILGKVEETSIEEVRGLYDVNVLGLVRVCRAALPLMRAQGSGTLINLSSLGGVVPVPYMSAYTSSKFAIEAFSEALYQEVRPDGIQVAIVQPVAMKMERAATGSHLEVAKGVSPESHTHRVVDRMVKDTNESQLLPEQVGTMHCDLRSSRVPSSAWVTACSWSTISRRVRSGTCITSE